MPLTHLVVGAGNMGKRHGAILEKMGDKVFYRDLGFEPTKAFVEGHDSVLICTPAETHAGFVDTLVRIGASVPLFVEKPAVHAIQPLNYYGISMVACNWRFCQCLCQPKTVVFGYPSDPVYGYLDLIHFLDYFWDTYGPPERGYLERLNDHVYLFCNTPRDYFLARFYDYEHPTVINGEIIHREGPCKMFVKQMEYWRHCVRNGIMPNNHIARATFRTNWLISLKRNCQFRDERAARDLTTPAGIAPHDKEVLASG